MEMMAIWMNMKKTGCSLGWGKSDRQEDDQSGTIPQTKNTLQGHRARAGSKAENWGLEMPEVVRRAQQKRNSPQRQFPSGATEEENK